MVEARGVSRGLHGHSEIDHVDHDLRMALWLHPAAHHTKAEQWLSILGHEGGDDGVEGAFPGLPAIGMFGIKAELCAAIEKEANLEHEGQTIEFGQPIETRFNEMMEGTKAELAVRIYGIDFDVLEKLAEQTRDIINSTPGGEAELETDGRTSTVVLAVKREVLGKYNMPLAELNRAVSAGLGGEVSGQVVEGNRKRDIVVRLPEEERAKEEVMKGLPMRVGDFGMISLGDAVDIRTEKTVEPIRHSRTQRRAALLVNEIGRAHV